MPNEVEILVTSKDKTDFSSTTRGAKDVAGGFDKAGEAADTLEGRSQGLASTLTGTTDTMAGLGEIAKGNLYEGLVLSGQGAADLFEGLNYLVIPLAKTVATTVAHTAASVAHRAATLASAAATNVMTVAQRALNFAMRANPIGLVITAIALLVTGIIIAYKKSETFRAIVQASMRGVQKAFTWIVEGFGAAWRTLSGAWNRFAGWVGGWKTSITRRVSSLFSAIGAALSTVWQYTGGVWLRFLSWVLGWKASITSRVFSLFSQIGSAFGNAWSTVSGAWGRFTTWVGGWKRALSFSGMFNGIASAFKSAINTVIGGWNRLSFSLPSVDTHIPGVGRVGGWTIHTPDLPYLASGGNIMRGGRAVVGERGKEIVDLPTGARVTPLDRAGGQPVVIQFNVGSGSRFITALIKDLKEQMRIDGGDVTVFGT